ncbi:MAG: hypothetical protein P4L87_05395, partial [Formivibrio sp.]|nr:hypothetical protein [Formivibrio sp.]
SLSLPVESEPNVRYLNQSSESLNFTLKLALASFESIRLGRLAGSGRAVNGCVLAPVFSSSNSSS